MLRLTAAGSSPRKIAGQLHLTYGTVRNDLASAVTKLNARNRMDAIRIATEAAGCKHADCIAGWCDVQSRQCIGHYWGTGVLASLVA